MKPASRTIYQLTCKRCTWSWWPRTASRPVKCPECSDPKWDQERIYRKKGSKA